MSPSAGEFSHQCRGVPLPRSLRVAWLAALPLLLASPASARSSGTTLSFVSAPNLHPPKLQVQMRKRGLAPGYFLVTDPENFLPHGRHTQGGPELLDSHVQPVWYAPQSGSVFDLQQETYQGRPVLLWYQYFGHHGAFVIYNEHYRRIATIQAQSPWMTDMHDASIVGGDIWITVARSIPVGSSGASTYDVGVQEFDVRTGRLLRTWDALNPGGKPNVPLSASEEAGVGDPYHLNSVQALPDGDLLLSMRNTWAVYLIDPVKQRIVWTLGGKRSTFTIPRDAQFAWQHDAQLLDPSRGGVGHDVELTLFDDNTRRGPAKGMVIRLDTIKHSAKLVSAYQHHPPYDSGVMGSMQVLPNGNALVGWGSYWYFTEFSASGRQLLNVSWPLHEECYRTLFTDSWVGMPDYPPSGAVHGNIVYASWDGATEVAKWQVLAGSNSRSLRVVATRPRTGFETAIRLSRHYKSYGVRALSDKATVLGSSHRFS